MFYHSFLCLLQLFRLSILSSILPLLWLLLLNTSPEQRLIIRPTIIPTKHTYITQNIHSLSFAQPDVLYRSFISEDRWNISSFSFVSFWCDFFIEFFFILNKICMQDSNSVFFSFTSNESITFYVGQSIKILNLKGWKLKWWHLLITIFFKLLTKVTVLFSMLENAFKKLCF